MTYETCGQNSSNSCDLQNVAFKEVPSVHKAINSMNPQTSLMQRNDKDISVACMISRLKLHFFVTAFLMILSVGCGLPSTLSGVMKGTTEYPQSSSVLVGTYYSGDGLGMNIELKLSSDSTFEAEWQGCLGKYGSATGRWSVVDTLLNLVPVADSGMLIGYLRVLLIQRFNGNWILVRSDKQDLEFYRKHGVSRYSCFQNTEVLFPGRL